MSVTAGKQALVELLRGEGVEYVFGIPGATEIHFMDALEQAPDIKYVLGLHEVVCAGMAEGYARASGKVGFLNLHTAPGVAAALPLLYNSYYGRVPLVITAGQNHTRLLQRDPHLSGDIVGMAKPFVKWATEICHAEDLPTVIQRAFKMAVQAPSGPVLVSLPQDVLVEEFEFDYRPNTVVYGTLRPDARALRLASELLLGARNPVLLVESGVARAEAVDEVVRFAELTGCRVYQSWMSDVNFPIPHHQYLGDIDATGPQGRDIFKNSDVLVGIGCSLFAEGFFNPGRPLPPGMKVIHIDDDSWEIGKNLPADCGLQGDIKQTVAELNELLEHGISPERRGEIRRRIAEIAGEKARRGRQLAAACVAEADVLPISISRLMTEIKAALTPDTVVVDECWSSSAALREIIAPAEPGRFLRSRKGGSIGWGLPAALGTKLGAPDKRVLAVVGDGSAAWSMQSFWTAARYRIPVTYVITNNSTYRQVKLVRKHVLGEYPLNERHEGMEIDDPTIDWIGLARSMGVEAVAVQQPDELRHAIITAIDSGKPRVVEVFVENKP